MVSDPDKLTKSIHRQRLFQPIRSANSRFPNVLRWFADRAGASVSWLLQAAIDFLIEDRCMMCSELSRQSQNPVDPSPSFSKFIAAGVRQTVFGLIKIDNHPLCRQCTSEFDETHGPGVIRIADSRNMPRPEMSPRAVIPLQDTHATSHSSPAPEESVETCLGIPVISPFMTNDPVLKLVHLIKFSAYTALIPPVARSIQAAFDHYREEDSDSCILVPVPMHQKQRKLRGFNQAELIARELSRGLDIPLQTEILLRHRAGVRQSMTPHEKRSANVHGAFSIKKGSLTGKHVLLVDDLVTTGATAAACSRTLFAAEAGSVTVLCLGRSL